MDEPDNESGHVILEYKQYLKEIKDAERLSCKLTSHTLNSFKNENFEKCTFKKLNSEIEPVLTSPEDKKYSKFWCKVVFYLLILTLFGAFAGGCVLYKHKISKYLNLAELYIKWTKPEKHLKYVFAIFLISEVGCVPSSVVCIFAGFILSGAYHDSCKVLTNATPVLCLASFFLAILNFFIGKITPGVISDYFKDQFIIIDALSSSTDADRMLLVFLGRLIPFLPSQPVNYLLGLSDFPCMDFLVSLTGNILSIFLYLFIGTGANDIFQILKSSEK